MTAAHIDVRVETAAVPPGALRVLYLEGHEALSTLFRFVVRVVWLGEAEGFPIEDAIGDDLSLSIARDDHVIRRVHGIVASVVRHGTRSLGHPEYTLELLPRLARGAFVTNLKVWVDPNLERVITEKLELLGLVKDADFVLRLTRPLPERPMLVQYRESDLDFVSRLFEVHGLVYFFSHEDDREVLVVTDHAGGFDESTPPTLGFHAGGEHREVYELAYERRLVAKNFVCRDYNDRTPNHAVSSERISIEEGDLGGVHEYGLGAQTTDEANVLARGLADRHLAGRDVFRGRAVEPALSPGKRVHVEGHPDEPPPLLLTRVVHTVRSSAVDPAAQHENLAYDAVFDAIPAIRVPRPTPRTPRPRIHGFLHGVIQTDAVGTIGKAARLDAEGRYLVKFRFDPAAVDETASASCRVRMMQPSAGPNYGMHFPLRPGVEVLVAFIDGDPDRPIIAGAVPNPTTPSPVVGRTSNKNRIKSASGALIELDDGT
ncbi:MAG: type VI secretion system tip protein TssI/VgrG [Polyangiaceae bacterium]